MARTPQLVDQWGRPVQRAELVQEVAGPTTTGVRSPLTGSPGDGLNPLRLRAILQEAENGDPLRYLELAQVIEERDLHYLGVLATRRKSVTGLDITVEDASKDSVDVEAGQLLRDWLQRSELEDEMFHILDAIGKGFSFTEIIWDRSMGQWNIDQLVYRDPRWFRFDRRDLNMPMMLGETGQEVPLPAYKFIDCRMQAKSGIAARGGIARPAMWAYLFKMFTLRDWAIFAQTYGQPIRLGKYPAGSTKEDRNKLYRAVANIAGDCAAIVPEGMQIDFVETGQVGASSDLYERRADWFDRQISKAVLGQTATTDAVTGGLGSGAEHRMVQEDIERADAKALAACINRDLVRPFIDLNFPGHGRYPRIVIARPEAEDVTAWMANVETAVNLGLPVAQDDVYTRLGLRRPSKDAHLLQKSGQNAPQATAAPGETDAKGPESEFEGGLNTLAALSARDGAPGDGKAPQRGAAPLDASIDRLATEAGPLVARMIEEVRAMVEAADTLEEARAMILTAFPRISQDELTQLFAMGFAASDLGGRAAVADEGADG
ncbi:DUF935 domain-containing protein [Sagittula sp. S175]|uniref:DUF935 domain-containing protein n=1 Tax=Sagittula sp. S175 TaxID=3415129 RepID=UPI003C7C4EC2